MKKIIAMMIVFCSLISAVMPVRARVEFYEPTHIIKYLESKGCVFESADYDMHEDDHVIEGNRVIYRNTLGYLRGMAYMYDALTHESDTDEFVSAAYADFDALVTSFEINDIENRRDMFAESFMLYCLNENEFGKTCSYLHRYMKNNVMKFRFDDVSVKDWYREVVEDAYYLGLMTGASDSLFKPMAKMNRAMVAVVFYRMEGSKKTSYKQLFSDVKNNEYYSQAITWAKENGVINGYKDGTFKPLRNVSREEMATMIYNFARYKGLNVRGNKAVAEGFSDCNQVSQYALEPMNWAIQNGIISGKDNGTRLDPLGTATRAECAKMLVEAYRLINERSNDND